MSAFRFSGILLLLAGCGGGGVAPDAGPTPDGGPAIDAFSLVDAYSPNVDAYVPPGSDAGATTCHPTAGTATHSPGCDDFRLAVIAHDGAPSELVLSGRIYPIDTSTSACAVIDGVDIVQSGATSTVVQHLDGGTSITLDSSDRELARGVPVAAVESLCTSDDPAMRFDRFGLVIRGHVDGGTFEAHCARAEGGTRWPPALTVTCHRNIDAPAYGGNASVTSGSFMGHPYASTMLYAVAEHGAGGALTSVDATIHVIPRRSTLDTGAPIAPFDTTGWMGSAGESGDTPPRSQLQAFASTVQLDTMLCPPPMTGIPGPGYVAPPVFLARLTGTGGHGAYSTEVFVGQCNTTSGP